MVKSRPTADAAWVSDRCLTSYETQYFGSGRVSGLLRQGCHRIYFQSSRNLPSQGSFIGKYFNFSKWVVFGYSLAIVEILASHRFT